MLGPRRVYLLIFDASAVGYVARALFVGIRDSFSERRIRLIAGTGRVDLPIRCLGGPDRVGALRTSARIPHAVPIFGRAGFLAIVMGLGSIGSQQNQFRPAFGGWPFHFTPSANVFHIVGFDTSGKIVLRKKFKRLAVQRVRIPRTGEDQ